ncbi:hypothetical protein [Maricaulis sp. CAU 1757]
MRPTHRRGPAAPEHSADAAFDPHAFNALYPEAPDRLPLRPRAAEDDPLVAALLESRRQAAEAARAGAHAEAAAAVRTALALKRLKYAVPDPEQLLHDERLSRLRGEKTRDDPTLFLARLIEIDWDLEHQREILTTPPSEPAKEEAVQKVKLEPLNWPPDIPGLPAGEQATRKAIIEATAALAPDLHAWLAQHLPPAEED